MTNRPIIAISLGTTFILAVAMTCSYLSADGPVPLTNIAVEDIGNKVQLIGRLGEPLGRMMTVKGTWTYPTRPGAAMAKDDSMQFVVTHVNEKKLAKSVTLNISQIHAETRAGKSALPKESKAQEALDGLTWTLRGFESGYFALVPEEFPAERGRGPAAPPYWYRPFTSELHGYIQDR
jgi:hypothetical protein